MRTRGADAGVAVARQLFISSDAAETWHEDGLDAWCEVVAAEQIAALAAPRSGDRDWDPILGMSGGRIRRAWAISALRQAIPAGCRDADRLAQLALSADAILQDVEQQVDERLVP